MKLFSNKVLVLTRINLKSFLVPTLLWHSRKFFFLERTIFAIPEDVTKLFSLALFGNLRHIEKLKEWQSLEESEGRMKRWRFHICTINYRFVLSRSASFTFSKMPLILSWVIFKKIPKIYGLNVSPFPRIYWHKI